MFSSGTAPTTSRLSQLGHGSRKLENLFRSLSGSQLAKVTPQSGSLSPPIRTPISGSLGLTHRQIVSPAVASSEIYLEGSHPSTRLASGYGCSNVCWYCVAGPLP
jgi:hypothetical protein